MPESECMCSNLLEGFSLLTWYWTVGYQHFPWTITMSTPVNPGRKRDWLAEPMCKYLMWFMHASYVPHVHESMKARWNIKRKLMLITSSAYFYTDVDNMLLIFFHSPIFWNGIACVRLPWETCELAFSSLSINFFHKSTYENDICHIHNSHSQQSHNTTTNVASFCCRSRSRFRPVELLARPAQ